MADVKTVIHALEQVPFITLDGVTSADIAELLKQLEPVKPVRNKSLIEFGWTDIWDCGNCGCQLRQFARYCDHCGRPVME